MFNTIFKKQFLIYFGSLLVSFILLGAVLLRVTQNYFMNQKKDLLLHHGEIIANVYTKAFTDSLIVGIYNINEINNDIRVLGKYMDESFIIINEQFEIITVSENILSQRVGVITDEELIPLFDGKIVTIEGSLGGLYDEQVLTVAYPIFHHNGDVIYGVLLSTSIPDLERTISDFFRITLICLLFSGCLAFTLIYFTVKNISKPLRQMNDAAKIIADGDFEKRICTKSKDEVGQLAESFNNMADSLSKQEKYRKEFISNISHDLRSPLTSMRGFLQAIMDGTIPEEKQMHYVSVVLDESERLAKLADDILDLNTIQSIDEIKLNKSKFDINELIRTTALKFERRVTEKKIEMSICFADDEDIILADYDKIQRVMYNLLDNAVKFTAERGKISIETYVKDDNVKISVSDNGRGINEEDQKRVFDRFFKADTSRGEDKKGSGLGLSIVREFIKAHGGTVVLESGLGKGCTFSFSLEKVDISA